MVEVEGIPSLKFYTKNVYGIGTFYYILIPNNINNQIKGKKNMKSNLSNSENSQKRGRLKTGSLEFVLKHAVQPGRDRKFLQANCAELAIQAGHGIEGYHGIWYREGDGKKFGCKNDLYFHQTCQKLGYTVVKIK